MTTFKTIIIFPYVGFESEDAERLFWKVVDQCGDRDIDKKPVVVLNRDTELRNQAKAFLSDPRRKKNVDTHPVWSVDTCQMWLAGWGYVLDEMKKKKKTVDRIVLLPGDIKVVDDEVSFFQKLDSFVTGTNAEIIIGDYNTGKKRGAKYFIDVYGTYPLLANWFPEVSEIVHKMLLERPRSEFLNIEVRRLKRILDRSKFAYEQTIRILVDCWESEGTKWKNKVERHDLGVIHDSDEFREYKGCLDQIERTERLLKVLWRDQNVPKPPKSKSQGQAYARNYKDFTRDYDELDRTSTQIRQTARIIIRALLGIK